MEDKRAVNVVLDSVRKIKFYCFLIGRFFEKNPGIPKEPKLYFCPTCANPALVHILGEHGKYREEWRCPVCGLQDGPGTRRAVPTAPVVSVTTIKTRVLTINGLVARALSAGNDFVKEVNSEGKEVNRPKRFDCPVCKAHAEKIGKPYTKSAIRVTGKTSGLCCTRSMATFGSGCRGWYPDNAPSEEVTTPVVTTNTTNTKAPEETKPVAQKAVTVKAEDSPPPITEADLNYIPEEEDD